MNYLKSKIKTLRYVLESLAVKLGILFFYSLKPQFASDLAAKISIFVGKKIAVNQLAKKNLKNALPNLSEKEREQVIDDMWDNLGRVVGEYPHVAKMSLQELNKIVEMSPQCLNCVSEMKLNKKGGIIFSAHLGNWELGPKILLSHGIEVGTVYRPLNNPYVEKMTASIRETELISKSTQGNRRIIEIIKNGGYVVIMADQKISEGEPVKFFHDDAITTTSIARIALRYDVPLIPARVIRKDKKFEFIADIEKPLEIQRTENINGDVLKLTLEINRTLEKWIAQYPAQWFWVHNRWKR